MTENHTPDETTPPKPASAPMMDTLLAYMHSAMRPVLDRIHIPHEGERGHNPEDILVPEGYTAEVVATGLSAPVHCCFDEQGYCYVSEAGHKIDSKPRVWKVDVRTGEKEVFFDLPEDRWNKTGAFTGACWHEGQFYFMNTGDPDGLGALSRLREDGTIEDLVTGLPWGDHQPNYPIPGPDGKLYWGQGTATNTAIVGADNYAYEWLRNFPDRHDYPGQDVVLTGRNYEYQNVLGNVTETVRTGAYVPFGTETTPGQVIEGRVKCTGSVLRCNPDGSDLELVAWGLRNPYGTAFHPDGRLFATEHNIDERSARHIIGDHEDFYEIKEGEWYGWPDFASGIRLDDPYWGERGRGREPVLAEHPNPNPPKPFATFSDHSGVNGLDFCRDARFGFEGDAFVALFGDLAPVTSRPATPRGFKVVRVDMKSGRVYDFVVNRIAGPASRLPHEGLERPSHCQFGPDGALYVVDWGEIRMAPEEGGIRDIIGTGTLWRIRRTEGPRGECPPEPIQVPLHALEAGVSLAGVVGAAIGGGMLIKKALRGGGAGEETGETRIAGSKKSKETLIAWLNDAYAMEQALIPVLENHAKDAKDFPDVAAADRRHLEETRRHAERVKGCIERLGETPSTAKSLLGQMLGAGQSVATGAFRDEVVKNFLSDYAAENFEIASYRALIAAARAVGDEETARTCEQILRDEERMAAWLTENLPRVVRETLRRAE
jgi:ferritin-like metal-binding protein YciE/glucose/arabinose dehydrogenase